MSDANGSGSAGSGSKGSRRVEYLAKIRYSNQLPPPPFAPKPVRYELPTSELLNAGSLSAVFLQRGVSPETDVELGMPVDLSIVDQVFDAETAEAAMCPPLAADPDIDPEDLVLLGDPQASGVGARLAALASGTTANSRSFAQSASTQISGPHPTSAGLTAAQLSGRDAADKPASEIGMGTSFLRRTAYMTGETRRLTKRKTGGSANSSRSRDESQIEAEIRRIEQTFDYARMPLASLKHPSKKNVTAVNALPLFPDSKESDLTFMEVKLLGSAALNTIQRKLDAEELQSSVFYKSGVEIGPEQTYEWMSFFAAETPEEAARLNQLRTELRDTLPAEEAQAEEQSVFPLQKLQDADFSVLKAQSRFEEVVLTQDENAYFCVPVSARYTLRRRRVAPQIQAQTRENEFDVLDLGLRELTPKESIQRDEVRSIYDPVNYG